jgi:protein-tyrosine phosphatase
VNEPPLIDLHTHILPGVDDGARDDAESLAMLAAAARDGITTLLATPHAHHVDAQTVIGDVERLNALACDAGIEVNVLPGHEARISAELVNRHRDGTLLTLNDTRWLLLECYLFDDWPIHLIERSVDRLLNAGLRPLLAHAERYPFVQRDPTVLHRLIQRGVPIQIKHRAHHRRKPAAVAHGSRHRQRRPQRPLQLPGSSRCLRPRYRDSR